MFFGSWSLDHSEANLCWGVTSYFIKGTGYLRHLSHGRDFGILISSPRRESFGRAGPLGTSEILCVYAWWAKHAALHIVKYIQCCANSFFFSVVSYYSVLEIFMKYWLWKKPTLVSSKNFFFHESIDVWFVSFLGVREGEETKQKTPKDVLLTSKQGLAQCLTGMSETGCVFVFSGQ